MTKHDHGERIAVLEANSDTQKETLDRLADSVSDLTKQLTALNTHMSEVRGGWKAFIGACTAAGVIGGIIATLLSK